MDNQDPRFLKGENLTVTVIYTIAALLCLLGGLLLNSFGLFADGVLSMMFLSIFAADNGKRSLSRTLCVGATVLGIYAAVVGFLKVSALIGYADSTVSIYVYPLFAAVIILKVAGLFFCDGENVRPHISFSLAVTVLVVIGTLLLTLGHYFEPAVACALGVYAVYLGGVQAVTQNRVACIDNLLHTLAQLAELHIGRLSFGKFAIKTATHRVADIKFCAGAERPYGLLQDERYGALIDTITLEVRDVDKTHIHRLEYSVIQLFKAIVGICRKNRMRSL